MAIVNKRNLEGTPSYSNSFKVLSNTDLMLKAIKMGVQIPDSDFTSIDILRELEKSRNRCNSDLVDSNDCGNATLFLTNEKGEETPIDMNWGMKIFWMMIILLLLDLREKTNKKVNVTI